MIIFLLTFVLLQFDFTLFGLSFILYSFIANYLSKLIGIRKRSSFSKMIFVATILTTKILAGIIFYLIIYLLLTITARLWYRSKFIITK